MEAKVASRELKKKQKVFEAYLSKLPEEDRGTRFVPDYEVVALAEFFHVSCEYLLGVQDKK